MRKIVTFDHVSADGYFSDPQGNLRLGRAGSGA